MAEVNIDDYAKKLRDSLINLRERWPDYQYLNAWDTMKPNLDWLRDQGKLGDAWARAIERTLSPKITRHKAGDEETSDVIATPTVREPWTIPGSSAKKPGFRGPWSPTTTTELEDQPGPGPVVTLDEEMDISITPGLDPVTYARKLRDWVKELRRRGGGWTDFDFTAALATNLTWLEKQGYQGKAWADWLREAILPTSTWSEWHKPAPTPPKPTPPTPSPWEDQLGPEFRTTPVQPVTEVIGPPTLSDYPRPPQPNIPTPKPEYPTPGRPPKVRAAFENIWAWRKKKPLWW